MNWVQGVGSVGAGTGVSEKATVYVGALWAENITWTEGYGTETAYPLQEAYDYTIDFIEK